MKCPLCGAPLTYSGYPRMGGHCTTSTPTPDHYRAVIFDVGITEDFSLVNNVMIHRKLLGTGPIETKIYINESLVKTVKPNIKDVDMLRYITGLSKLGVLC